MSDSYIRVNLVGGSTLTRDLFANMLDEAGMNVITTQQPSVTDSNEVALIIAEDDNPTRLLSDSPARRTVVIADVDANDDAVVDLVLDGADAVIGFDAGARDLATAITTVAKGGTLLAPRPARRLIELARSSRVATTPERALLTSREIDILLSIGRGESVKQTASTLGISAKTVENLQSRLFRKLDVRNRAQAFAQAHAMGLLPLAAQE